MSNPDGLDQRPTGAASSSSLDHLHRYPVAGTDLRVPLHNLSTVSARMGSVQSFLSDKINTNTLIGDDQMSLVSSEIAAAIHQVIVNGAALLACSQLPNTSFQPVQPLRILPKSVDDPHPNVPESDLKLKDSALDHKLEEIEEDVGDKWHIVELDAVELLAEHVHFCEICGKGFKRDANLRMHMRAHGNQFKTHEALLKPEKATESDHLLTRFSCPFTGCNRNKHHKKFRPLKSVICVKNHFKRSHCPKMYSCNRCNKKSFSVVADLKSHMKHCGECKWKCSCGTSFSRKDKLFGHMALFEGHMPAIMEDEEESKEIAVLVEDDDHEEVKAVKEIELGRNGGNNDGFFDGLLDGFDSIENFCFQDGLGGSGSGSGAGNDWFL